MMSPEERGRLVGVTLRLTPEQLEGIDALVKKRNAMPGPTKANRQSVLSYFVELGLKDAVKPR